MSERRENKHKLFVKVRADHLPDDGRIVPLLLKTPDDVVIRINRILDMRPAASLKAGGQGMRYTCDVGESGDRIFLFHDGAYWFIEV